MNFDLLVADRDDQELNGIIWLISNYAFAISAKYKVKHPAEFMQVLENKQPNIVCLELDMIPPDKWEMVKQQIDLYADQVIAITAEATFERATQALEIQALDLWVKPLSPSVMKFTLQQAFRTLSFHKKDASVHSIPKSLDYESLFVDNQIPFGYPVYLLKTEFKEDLPHLRQFIHQFDFYIQPTVFSVSDLVVLVFHKEIHEVTQQPQRLMREWELLSGSPLVIAVHTGEGEKSLHQIYTTLRKTMEVTFFTGFKQILLSSNENWEDMDPFLTPEEQRTWVSFLNNGDKTAIKSWMYDRYFEFKPPYPDPGMLRTQLTSILAQVRRFMNRKQLTGKTIELYYKNVFERILYSPVLYRIVQDMILFVYQLIDKMNAMHSLSHSDPISEAIAYMEDNYSDSSLNLTKIAAHVGRSPSYLSHLFTKRENSSFKKILADIRINKAKEKLLTTDDSVQFIAEEVGYKNANYFSKVFKETTNFTPSQFKNKK